MRPEMMYGGFLSELKKQGILQPGKNDGLVPVAKLHLQGVCSGLHVVMTPLWICSCQDPAIPPDGIQKVRVPACSI
jgi:hypothetical protein